MNQQSIIADIEFRARRLGVSISALCREAGVHPTTFSRWKKSERNPEPIGARLSLIMRLQEAVGRHEARRQAATDQVYARLANLQRTARMSVVGGEVPSDADRVREALKVLCRCVPAIIAKALAERISLLCRPFGQAGRGVIGAGDQRDHQEFQGVDAIGEGCGHQGSPSGGIAADEKAIADRTIAHRLSGEPK